MKRIASLALLLCVAVTGLTAIAADTMSADEHAIMKIEHEWNEALKNKNKAFFEKTLSKDFIHISELGEVSNGPAAFIEMVMQLSIVEYTASDERIKVYGSTGVATGRWSAKDDKGSVTALRYMDVYAKGPDGWKSVAAQETTTK
ncbi:MAG TPA: nuclear transport factor 2 family protein [Pseudomonadales bacterium]